NNTADNNGGVGSGNDNVASGLVSVVPGGGGNQALGTGSFAAGILAHAAYAGDFVWADAQGVTLTATAPNQFLVRAGGGVGLNPSSPAATLDVSGTARLGRPGTVLTALQAGTVTVYTSSTSSLVYTLTFPSAFGALPNVIATAYNDPAYFGGDD